MDDHQSSKIYLLKIPFDGQEDGIYFVLSDLTTDKKIMQLPTEVRGPETPMKPKQVGKQRWLAACTSKVDTLEIMSC